MNTETAEKARDIIGGSGGRLIVRVKGPNDTKLEFWHVGTEVLILQIFADGGVSHFVQGKGNTWKEMEQQVKEIARVK